MHQLAIPPLTEVSSKLVEAIESYNRLGDEAHVEKLFYLLMLRMIKFK